MNHRQNASTVTSNILALALACAATGVSAQEIFKLVDAGGKITFSDRPEATSQPASIRNPDAVNPPPRIAGTFSRRAAALVDANEATRRFRQAQSSRKLGMEPQPGEQAQGAGGGTVNARYWRRQEKLRLEFDDAQRRMAETGRQQLAER
jgi:Domain of unknown function (DUF4124)